MLYGFALWNVLCSINFIYLLNSLAQTEQWIDKRQLDGFQSGNKGSITSTMLSTTELRVFLKAAGRRSRGRKHFRADLIQGRDSFIFQDRMFWQKVWSLQNWVLSFTAIRNKRQANRFTNHFMNCWSPPPPTPQSKSQHKGFLPFPLRLDNITQAPKSRGGV